MSGQGFIDAIDSLKISITGNVAGKCQLPMGLTFEYDSCSVPPNNATTFAKEIDVSARFGGRLFVDESALDGHDIDNLVSRMKSDMKRIVFADALDFAQSVAAVAAKNGNRELLKMAFDFQDRILKTK